MSGNTLCKMLGLEKVRLLRWKHVSFMGGDVMLGLSSPLAAAKQIICTEHSIMYHYN